MNNTISVDSINRHKPFLKNFNNLKNDVNFFGSSTKKINDNGTILSITPSPKLTIMNFEYDKNFIENISIKNLMSFPIVLKLRSSDNRKLEVTKNIVKLCANQTATIDLNLRINSKNAHAVNQQTQSKDNKLILFILIKSEVGDIKYFVEIDLKSAKLDRPERLPNLDRSVRFKTPNRSLRLQTPDVAKNQSKIKDNKSELQKSDNKENLVREHDINKKDFNTDNSNAKSKNLSDINFIIFQNFKSFGGISSKNVDYLLESSKTKINLYHEFSENLNNFDLHKERQKFSEIRNETEPNFSNDYNANLSFFQKEKEESIKDKKIFTNLKIANDIKSNFTPSKTKENIINTVEENKYLKIKIESLMKKFKEFENLIKIYAELISSYESNQFEIEKNSRNLKKNSVIYNSYKISSSFNNLLIDLVESFRIVKENELNTNTYRVSDTNSSLRTLSENFQLNSNLIKDSPLKGKFGSGYGSKSISGLGRLGLNFNYSNKIIENRSKKSRSIDFVNNEIELENGKKYFSPFNSNKINYQPIRQMNKLFKFNHDQVSDDVLNYIKQMFIDIEFSNYKENKRRADYLVKLVTIMNNLLFSNKNFSGLLNCKTNNDNKNFSQPEINYSSKNYDIKKFDNYLALRVSSPSISRRDFSETNNNYNVYLEKYFNKFEILIKNLSNIISPVANHELSLADIENKIITKKSILRQDQILSSKELEFLYKEIQNLNIISNDLNNFRLENKKFVLEINLFKKEILKKESIIEEYRVKSKNLERDIEIFKKELYQRDHSVTTKDFILDELKKENLYLKENFIKPDDHQKIIKQFQERINLLLDGENYKFHDIAIKKNMKEEDLFKIISIKDDEIIELKAQLVIKNHIIENIKNRSNRRASFKKIFMN